MVWISEVMTKNKVVIAVDGPAASGKGSLSRRLSKDYNLAHMDSGKLYRATALIIIENNINPEEKNKVEQYIKYIDFDNSIFENKKLIGWQHFGKNKWIYKLEEIDGKTKVTHIFDWSKSMSEKSVQFFIKQNKANMSNSLNKLEEFLNRIYT